MSIEPLPCNDCDHMRVKPLPDLPPDAHHVGLAKSLGRLHQLTLELMGREELAIDLGQSFDFEPAFFPWCARFSTVDRREWWACRTKNSNGLCLANTARSAAGAK